MGWEAKQTISSYRQRTRSTATDGKRTRVRFGEQHVVNWTVSRGARAFQTHFMADDLAANVRSAPTDNAASDVRHCQLMKFTYSWIGMVSHLRILNIRGPSICLFGLALTRCWPLYSSAQVLPWIGLFSSKWQRNIIKIIILISDRHLGEIPALSRQRLPDVVTGTRWAGRVHLHNRLSPGDKQRVAAAKHGQYRRQTRLFLRFTGRRNSYAHVRCFLDDYILVY